MTFPWIYDSEMQTAHAGARLEAEGVFDEAAREYREFKQRIEADPAWQRFWAERERDKAITAVFDGSRADYLRSLYSERQREQLAAQRDMTPGAPHPDPRLAAAGWQASDHGTYVRRPPEHEAEAG